MKKIFVFLFTVIVFTTASTSSLRAEYIKEIGALYFYDSEIKSEYGVVFKNEKEVELSVRTLLEAIGSEVIWDKETGDILINYSKMIYKW